MAILPASPKQDRGGVVRNAADLELKYDLAAIVGMKKAVLQMEQQLTKTNSILENFVKSTVGTLENMQNQIDGNITTWFDYGKPTQDTYPTNEWVTEELKINHIGDLYYDRNTGYGYRYEIIEDGSYSWEKIKDNDVVEALAIANAAKDTADNKRRVFVAKPVPPYDSGDLWFTAEGEIYICQIGKDSAQAYAEKDFIIATKYTDDTYAKQVGNELMVVRGTVTTIKESMDEFSVEIDILENDILVAQSQIEANTEQIELRVMKDGIIGAINLSSEAALIQAKRINLTGAVTISALATDVTNEINTAKSNANAAVSTANTASSNASAAVSAANTANTNANAAVSTANTASKNASSAVSTANTANTNASNAVSTANTANSTATAANSTADGIKNNIYKSGTTLIDGAKIHTGSITADKIKVTELAALGATIGGWTIETGEIKKNFPQLSIIEYAKDITGSYSGNYTIYSENSKKVQGLISTHFDYWGLRFENNGGMGIEYGARGVSVAPSTTAVNNEEYELILGFSEDNVWAKKLSTNAIACNGDAYLKNVYGGAIKGTSVVTTSGADLDKINSNLFVNMNWETLLTTNATTQTSFTIKDITAYKFISLELRFTGSQYMIAQMIFPAFEYSRCRSISGHVDSVSSNAIGQLIFTSTTTVKAFVTSQVNNNQIYIVLRGIKG